MVAKPWHASAKLSLHQNHLEGLLKHKLMDIFLRISDSISLGWGPRIYISNKPPGVASAAGVGHLQATAKPYMGAKDYSRPLLTAETNLQVLYISIPEKGFRPSSSTGPQETRPA